MKIEARLRKMVACLLVIMIITSMMTFPEYSYGNNESKNLIAIKTINGKYLSAKDGGGALVNATRDKIGDWETFQIVDLGRGKFALKSYNGEYIRVSKDGNSVYADSDEIGKRETFQLVVLKNKKVALKTHDDKYICAEDGGGKEVVANRDKIGGWETFEFVKVEEARSDRVKLHAKSDVNGITFTWSKSANIKNIIGYNLYRGTASGKQDSTPITDFPIEGTSYLDKNIERNTNYYYILKPVYRGNILGNPSNEVLVKSGANTTKIVIEVGSKYMYINGNREEIDPGRGTAVTINNGRTFLPIRAVVEAMGGEVRWRESDKRVSIYLKEDVIHLWIGDKIAKVNGKNKETDVAPYISDRDRTMLPLRFIAENLDLEVNWDGPTKTVTITMKR